MTSLLRPRTKIVFSNRVISTRLTICPISVRFEKETGTLLRLSISNENRRTGESCLVTIAICEIANYEVEPRRMCLFDCTRPPAVRKQRPTKLLFFHRWITLTRVDYSRNGLRTNKRLTNYKSKNYKKGNGREAARLRFRISIPTLWFTNDSLIISTERKDTRLAFQRGEFRGCVAISRGRERLHVSTLICKRPSTRLFLHTSGLLSREIRLYARVEYTRVCRWPTSDQL